jgi:hypothetical protein
MANNQYNIPGQVGEGPLQEALHIADTVRYTPESQPAPFQFLKQIEQDRYTAREATLELNRKKSSSGLSFGLGRRVTLEKLMRQESELGGTIFGKEKGFLFWLDHKNTSNAQQNQIGDWYLAQPQFINGKKSLNVTHYLTTPYTIEKRFAGASYPVSIKETQDFLRAVDASMEVTRPLYVMEEMLYDLTNEIKEENTPHLSVEEKMANEAIVQQMYANHQQRKNDEHSDYDLAA